MHVLTSSVSLPCSFDRRRTTGGGAPRGRAARALRPGRMPPATARSTRTTPATSPSTSHPLQRSSTRPPRSPPPPPPRPVSPLLLPSCHLLIGEYVLVRRIFTMCLKQPLHSSSFSFRHSSSPPPVHHPGPFPCSARHPASLFSAPSCSSSSSSLRPSAPLGACG